MSPILWRPSPNCFRLRRSGDRNHRTRGVTISKITGPKRSCPCLPGNWSGPGSRCVSRRAPIEDLNSKQNTGALVEVACPLCRATNAALYVMAPSHYGPEKHQVTRCLECGMIYTNPQPTTYLDEVEHRGALDRHFRPEVLAGMDRQGRFLLHLLS